MTEKIQTAFGPVTPATSFRPDVWMRDIQEGYIEQMKQSARHSLMMRGIDPDNIPTISVEEPLPEEFLTGRAEFSARWDAIIAEGEAAGYLDTDGSCVDCGGGLEVTTNDTTYTRQPNPDFDPDKPNPYAEALNAAVYSILKAPKETP